MGKNATLTNMKFDVTSKDVVEQVTEMDHNGQTKSFQRKAKEEFFNISSDVNFRNKILV